jgi:hypothetical protein
MGFYNIHSISILLDLLLANEQLTRDRKGFVELLERVEDKVENEEERSEKQYLYKLNNRIKEELRKGKDTIQMKESCLTNCLIFLRYESFKNLSSQIDKVQKQVETLFAEKIDLAILMPTVKKSTWLDKIEEAQYQGQQITFLEQQYDPENAEWKKAVSSMIKQRATIWFISSHLFQNQLETVKELLSSEKMNSNRVLPFFLVSKPSELTVIKEALNSENLLGGSDDLLLLIQLLMHNLKKSGEEETLKEENNQSIIIHTGGGIGIGVVHAKKFNQTTNITNNN